MTSQVTCNINYITENIDYLTFILTIRYCFKYFVNGEKHYISQNLSKHGVENEAT